MLRIVLYGFMNMHFIYNMHHVWYFAAFDNVTMIEDPETKLDTCFDMNDLLQCE